MDDLDPTTITNPVTMIRALQETIAESERVLREMGSLTAAERAELIAGIDLLTGNIATLRGFLIAYDGIPPE